MTNDAPAADRLRRNLVSYAYVSVFCVGVALLIGLLNAGGTWMQNLTVSFSVGFCVNTAFILLSDPLEKLIGPRLAPIPTTAIGVVAGLMLGAWLVAGRPLYFFSADDDGLGSIVLGVFFGVLGFIYFSTRSNLLSTRAQLAEAQAGIEREERLRTETELRLLQAQIEPHFLFNTLSNVISLIRTEPKAAENTLVQLTQYLRASLKRSRESRNTLSDEFDLVRAYLQIQQARMGDRLSFELDADSNLMLTELPPLLIQPLVENAVVHGIEPSQAGGKVTVTATRSNGWMQVRVSDDGVGLQETNGGNRLALSNIRDRLTSLYGSRARLTLTDNTPCGIIASIDIPVAEE